MTRKRVLSAIGFGIGCGSLVYAIAAPPPKKSTTPAPVRTIEYARDVRPILAQHCFSCHGSDKEALAKTGNVSLDTFAGATANRNGRRSIVPGHPDKSVLFQRVTTKEMDDVMPPPGSGMKPLSKAEIATLKTWVKEGATYATHWAFEAPKLAKLPVVKNQKWARNDIDRFVLARLEAAKLQPEPEADKATLLRRVKLTLTGLPPTPQEVDEFLADKRPDAYERMVDRELASPRYGEHQARFWLDAVRYADTHGLHIDNERAVYPYRDWVVRAYNQDLPFDKFATWQLAGDLLPNPSLDQQIATGYVRMNPTSAEGGAIEDEFLAKNTMDRVDTTSTIFLGLTVGCAKCHDHKFDPISMRDYYAMYGFFNNTVDTPLDGNSRLHAPVIKAPSPEQAAQVKEYTDLAKKLEDGTDVDAARKWVLANAPVTPKVGPWEIAGPFEAADFDKAFATNFGPERRGDTKTEWKPVDFSLDKIKEGLVGKDNAAIYLRTTLSSTIDQTLELRLGSDDGIRVWLNGSRIHDNKTFRPPSADADSAKGPIHSGDNILLIKIVNATGGDGAFVGFGGPGTARFARVRDLAQKPTLTAEERQALVAAYLELGPDSAEAGQYRNIAAAQANLDTKIPMTLVAQERTMPRITRLLKRGQYDQPGEVVERGVPSAFGSVPAGAPKNRLGLARWLTDPKNPLVSRVFVNRIWQQHFGNGLVRSSEDFGSRGELPTHPELLDYLALRTMNTGWSLKKLHRLILTSATFRQASTADKVKRNRDPENKLISRMPRFRLDAEVIRDVALFDSGLLVEREGGKGDKPYQPSGLWEAIAYPISDTAKYMQDHGDALYRRSLYLFWKRTSPPPSMMLFDAPMRESCVVQRSRTNTPTQALAGMNETGFAEAARAFAERVIKTKPDDTSRVDFAFRVATGRRPKPEERDVLLKLVADQRTYFQNRPQFANRAVTVGESPRDTSIDPADQAAYMLVCNLLLNLDETLTQH